MASLAVSADAVETGSFVYTLDARMKVSGENIVTNGNFANSTTGWTNGVGGSVDLSVWSYVEGVGPNGENALEASSSGMAAQSIEIAPGSVYMVSYDIYSPNDASTSTVSGYSNYVGIYLNNDGSFSTSSDGYRLVNSASGLKEGWNTVTDTIDCSGSTSTQYLQIVFENLYDGERITNVAVQEVTMVYDDRIAQRLYKYCKFLIDNADEFKNANKSDEVNGLEDFQGIVSALEEALADDDKNSSTAEMEDLIPQVEGEAENFLAANAADMRSQYTGWEKITSNQKNKSTIGSWKFTGSANNKSRWSHFADNVQEVSFDLPGAYDLMDNSATLTLSLPAGRYLFEIEVAGYHYSGTTSSTKTVPNYNSSMLGQSIFMNGDTIACDTLPTKHYDRYTYFFTAEEGENNINVGTYFSLPEAMVDTNLGGHLMVANSALYLLGSNSEDLDSATCVANIIAAQEALKTALDNANAAYGTLEQGNEELKALTDSCQTVYDQSFSVVDSEGNFIGDHSYLTDEEGNVTTVSTYVTELQAATSQLKSLTNSYLSQNLKYYAVENGFTASAGLVINVVETCPVTYSETESSWGSSKSTTNWVDTDFKYYVSGSTNGKFSSGSEPTGCYVKFTPTVDGIITAAVVLNANKAIYIVEGTNFTEVTPSSYDLPASSGATSQTLESNKLASKSQGTISWEVKAGTTYYLLATGSKLGFYGFKFNEGASGINEVATTATTDGKAYNLQGQRVGEGYTGLTIKNGKKFIK